MRVTRLQQEGGEVFCVNTDFGCVIYCKCYDMQYVHGPKWKLHLLPDKKFVVQRSATISLKLSNDCTN